MQPCSTVKAKDKVLNGKYSHFIEKSLGQLVCLAFLYEIVAVADVEYIQVVRINYFKYFMLCIMKISIGV